MILDSEDLDRLAMGLPVTPPALLHIGLDPEPEGPGRLAWAYRTMRGRGIAPSSARALVVGMLAGQRTLTLVESHARMIGQALENLEGRCSASM